MIGYLTGDDEGSVADIDALLITPQAIASHTLIPNVSYSLVLTKTSIA